MQAHGQLASEKRGAGGPADDPHIHALRNLLIQQLHKGAVGDLHVVNQQVFPCAFDELDELLARVLRTHYELMVPRLVRTTLGVTLEQLHGLAHQLWLQGTHGKGAAEHDVNVAEVEGHHVELFAVDDEHLAVIPEQVVGSAGHRHSSLGRIGQCSFHFAEVDPEDHDMNAFLRLAKSCGDGTDPVLRLHNQFHGWSLYLNFSESGLRLKTPDQKDARGRVPDVLETLGQNKSSKQSGPSRFRSFTSGAAMEVVAMT